MDSIVDLQLLIVQFPQEKKILKYVLLIWSALYRKEVFFFAGRGEEAVSAW